MSAVIVTGDDRTIRAALTIDKTAVKAGEALTAAVLVTAILLNRETRARLTPVYVISPSAIDTIAATVEVTIPSADSALLKPAVQTVLEIQLVNGLGKKLTFTNLGPIEILKAATP